jgi:L-ribulose-5-phosphate 3-epimerase
MSTGCNRRQFLAAGAGAFAAGLVPQDSKPVPKRTLKKAAMIGMVRDGKTALDKFQLLRDCGFEGVEMDSPSNTPIESILAAQEKTGIKVHGMVDSVHWQLTLTHKSEEVRKKGLEALVTALRDGKTLGASSVLLVPGVVDRDQPYDEAYKRSQEMIRQALPVAEETKVKIAVENVWNQFLLSPLEAARYVDELQSPWVGWHMDIGNVINHGFPDQWIRILGKRILKLHIKDFSRKKRDSDGLWKGFEVELGEGDAGWKQVMRALDEIGYSTAEAGNWATAEVRGGGRDRLQQVAAQMDKLFAM